MQALCCASKPNPLHMACRKHDTKMQMPDMKPFITIMLSDVYCCRKRFSKPVYQPASTLDINRSRVYTDSPTQGQCCGIFVLAQRETSPVGVGEYRYGR